MNRDMVDLRAAKAASARAAANMVRDALVTYIGLPATDAHILYRLYAGDWRLLYVGITDRGPRRLSEHAKDKPWWRDVEIVTMDRYPDRASVEFAERYAIGYEAPLHNKIRHGAAPPALESLTPLLPAAPSPAHGTKTPPPAERPTLEDVAWRVRDLLHKGRGVTEADMALMNLEFPVCPCPEHVDVTRQSIGWWTADDWEGAKEAGPGRFDIASDLGDQRTGDALASLMGHSAEDPK